MQCAVLTFEIEHLGPDAKFILARFVQRYGLSKAAISSIRELAETFGFSDRMAKKALTELVRQGVLSDQSARGGRGRPKSQYQLQSKFVSDFKRHMKGTSFCHELTVDDLLKSFTRKDKGFLSTTNRLLLATLLCRADHFGIVEDMGASELSRLTGLGRERLKYRLQTLIDLGFIRGSVPGASSLTLFRPTKSVYFLNLHHPDLLVLHKARVVVCVTEWLSTTSEMDEAARISAEANYYSSNYEYRSSDLETVTRFAEILGYFEDLGRRRDEHSRRVARLLQLRLEAYAAYFLSNFWAQLPEAEELDDLTVESVAGIIEDQILYVRIAKDFKSPRVFRSAINNDLLNETSHEYLVRYLYVRAFKLAQLVKGFLLSIPDEQSIPFDCMDFAILPRGAEVSRRHCALLCLSRATEHETSDRVVVATSNGKDVSTKCFGREADIPPNLRYEYRLLTNPESQSSTA